MRGGRARALALRDARVEPDGEGGGARHPELACTISVISPSSTSSPRYREVVLRREPAASRREAKRGAWRSSTSVSTEKARVIVAGAMTETVSSSHSKRLRDVEAATRSANMAEKNSHRSGD